MTRIIFLSILNNQLTIPFRMFMAILEELVKEVGERFKSRGLKLVTAESCTGGGLAYTITSIPGSSAWFDRGWVTYSNTSKIELLGVNPETLTAYGSVSEQVAKEMAEGALQHSEAQISIALTGIAGPGGGSLDKPVGTVWIACTSTMSATQVTHHLFTGERAVIREKSIEAALTILNLIQ